MHYRQHNFKITYAIFRLYIRLIVFIKKSVKPFHACALHTYISSFVAVHSFRSLCSSKGLAIQANALKYGATHTYIYNISMMIINIQLVTRVEMGYCQTDFNSPSTIHCICFACLSIYQYPFRVHEVYETHTMF